ncbi:hypothetical protein G5I_14250 [Acromyrmex echinatior]|uniref:Uncharacterized protein n=1 Tax=Acromyrmex echinatior TaxID=103372 RepID=F4X7B0_ACREC|nr:hypothetical protein G5I_14250 [Acromyrmex echinatior]
MPRRVAEMSEQRRRNQEHERNERKRFSKVHYTEPEPRPAGAENLTLFAKLPESADAAFKDGISAWRSNGEALEWFE